MRHLASGAGVAIALATVLVSIAVPAQARDLRVVVDTVGKGDELEVSAFDGEKEFRLSQNLPPAQRKYEYLRTSDCMLPAASDQPCPAIESGLVCEDGAPVRPLWRRALEDGAQWHVRSDWACPEDLIPALTREDLRRLKIDPLKVNQQPAEGPMLVTKPVIVYTEPAVREFRVVLFDLYDVDVRVAPEEYMWDFGDGRTLATTEPGRPYPAFDLTHVYRERGTAHITLTTTWSAEYRVDADPAAKWREADGTVTTIHQGVEFEVIELRTRLVG